MNDQLNHSLLIIHQSSNMSTQKINPRFAILAIMMIAVAALRIPNAAQ